MSATDDAQMPRSARMRLAPWIGAMAGVALGAAALSVPTLLPDLPRYQARLLGSDDAPSSFGTSAAQAVERAQSAGNATARELSAARGRLAHQLSLWRTGPFGPLPSLDPRAECAARLLARARLSQLLAGDGAVGPPASPGGAEAERRLLEAADFEVEARARETDAVGLEAAMTRSDLAAALWLRAGEENPSRRWQRWRERERDRGQRFAEAASVLLTDVSPFQRELVTAALPGFAATQAHDAAVALNAAQPPPVHLRVSPVLSVWLVVMLLAAAFGSVVAAIATRAGDSNAREAPSRSVVAEEFPPAELLASRLHLVSGANRDCVARGMAEVAVPALENGARVLAIDASALGLHRNFGAGLRWGLAECVAGELPLLGTIQPTGVAGLYLLARGWTRRPLSWDSVLRLARDAQDHFDRVVLAMDAGVKDELAAAPETTAIAWWAQRTNRPAAARRALSKRTGLEFHELPLPRVEKNWIADLAERIAVRREAAGVRFAPTELAANVAPAPVRIPEPEVLDTDERLVALLAQLHAIRSDEVATRAGEKLAMPVQVGDVGLRRGPEEVEPSTSEFESAGPEPRLAPRERLIESDQQTSERLRFLLWMRQMQRERAAAKSKPRTTSAA